MSDTAPAADDFEPDLTAAIDTWIAEEAASGREISRPEAVRRLVAEALQTMGLYSVRARSRRLI